MNGFLMDVVGRHQPVNAMCAIRAAGLAGAELWRRQGELLNAESYKISSSLSQ